MIISIANRKGGVGKTTLTLHLAAGLAMRGLKVVTVDADPQGNLTSWMLNSEDDGMYRLLTAKRLPRLTEVVSGVTVDACKLGLVSGDSSTGDALALLAFAQRLDEVPQKVKWLGQVADFVLLDMPPSQAVGFKELLAASDYALVPTQLERLSIEGVFQMAALAVELGVKLLGVVPNMVQQTREHREQLEELIAAFGRRADVIWGPIPRTIRFAECHAYRKTLFELAPQLEATQALRETVAKVLEVTRD